MAGLRNPVVAVYPFDKCGFRNLHSKYSQLCPHGLASPNSELPIQFSRKAALWPLPLVPTAHCPVSSALPALQQYYKRGQFVGLFRGVETTTAEVSAIKASATNSVVSELYVKISISRLILYTLIIWLALIAVGKGEEKHDNIIFCR